MRYNEHTHATTNNRYALLAYGWMDGWMDGRTKLLFQKFDQHFDLEDDDGILLHKHFAVTKTTYQCPMGYHLYELMQLFLNLSCL